MTICIFNARQIRAENAQGRNEDRRTSRMAEIEELLSMYQAQRDTLNAVIFTLENEHELHRKAKP